MIEKLICYLEKRPRAVITAVLVFMLALSAVSGLCFYVLTIVIDSERHAAMQEVYVAKERFEERAKILRERASVNSENIVRLADTLVPLLKIQAEDIKKLKEQFAERSIKNASDVLLYAKLSEVEYRLVDLEQRLLSEKTVAVTMMAPAPETGYPDSSWLETYLLQWLIRWCIIIAIVSFVLLVVILKYKRSALKQVN